MRKLLICIILILTVFSVFLASPAYSARAVVRAVLFYSPTCGHCHYVITEVLPPLFEKYGDQLQIVALDVSRPAEQELFRMALDHFKVEYAGVPFLAIGDNYLVGSVDIPEQFPGLIETYLAQGGVDWPPVSGLAEAMKAIYPSGETSQVEATPIVSNLAQATKAAYPSGGTSQVEAKPIVSNLAQATKAAYPSGETSQVEATPIVIAGTSSAFADLNIQSSRSLVAKFAQDPLGNSLAVIVLVGMLFVLGVSVLSYRHTIQVGILKIPFERSWNRLIPVLCVAGLGVAGYLAYVELTQVEAVCGPVGDCNTVQQSEYATLFGVLPIGLLGIVGYILILIAWGISHTANQRLAAFAALAQQAMVVFGVVFSIYLTFLEPFIIGATCAWCLTSAVIMTALLWLSLAPARVAFSFLLHGEK